MDESTRRSREKHQREQDFLAANPGQHGAHVINTNPVDPSVLHRPDGNKRWWREPFSCEAQVCNQPLAC